MTEFTQQQMDWFSQMAKYYGTRAKEIVNSPDPEAELAAEKDGRDYGFSEEDYGERINHWVFNVSMEAVKKFAAMTHDEIVDFQIRSCQHFSDVIDATKQWCVENEVKYYPSLMLSEDDYQRYVSAR